MTTKYSSPPIQSKEPGHEQQQATQQQRATLAQVKKAAGSQSLQSLQDACRGWTGAELDENDPAITTKTPLHMAAWKGCLANVQYLIEEMQCDIDVYSKGEFSYGKTAIFFAATQSRVDVMTYLLQKEAKVTIVNNKGQSVSSIASSHEMPSHVMERIQQLEALQQNWWNFRASHSDGLEYGDLDPRFFDDRPLRDTDVITALAINPTTKQTRKGGFARRNPEIYQQRKQQQQANQEEKQAKARGEKRPNNKSPGLTDEQKQQWDQLWEDMTRIRNTDEGTTETSSSILRKIVNLGNHYRRPWIPDATERLLRIYDNGESELDAILSEAQKLPGPTEREVELLQKIQMKVLFGDDNESGGRKATTTTVVLPRSKKPTIAKQQEAWKYATSLTKHLSIKDLEENERCGNDNNNLTLPHPPEFIDSLEAMHRLQEQLIVQCATSKGSNSQFLIAIDAEWYDIEDEQAGDVTSALSTVQIAFCDEQEQNRIHTFVVDLTIQDPDYNHTAQEVVQWILHSPDLLVLGFALSHDVHMLERFSHESSSNNEPDCLESTFLDLQQLFAQDSRQQLPGLKTCASKFSTFPLSKVEQCSEWGQRPLRQSQLDYAGLDAAILLVLLAEDHRRRQTELQAS